GDTRQLHSLPAYYGWHAALHVLIPALAGIVLWLVIQPMIIETRISRLIPTSEVTSDHSLSLVMVDVRKVAEGLDRLDAQNIAIDPNAANLRLAMEKVGIALASDISPNVLIAAQEYRKMQSIGSAGRTVLVLALGLIGFLIAWRRTNPELRARNRVELVVQGLLIAASSIAILTTIGIIYSMLSETINFFGQYSWTEFFFGTTWSPNFRGDSDLGILPLLWGTMYISLVSMIVAVPIGLFAAIYMAEYASPRARSWLKPMIEVIAGIPTIVFGLFALITVGPILRDYIAEPLGWGSSGSSVMTAGIVIGIMNVPFISSLSDDIINAVPQSLRDGAYGLGATRSETIRQVVLPAALPGIVGAVLMAASRAIGETMVAVMGAGAAARLDLNPFEAMTTITVKIVGQLTGDTDFNSPETLVAFALGMTLFVVTLGLNVLALFIVRKYREQYE
ncbi:MAG: phosphate ABC transporter permease subunit PstC, partial [Deltaproteobacteria bacterium]